MRRLGVAARLAASLPLALALLLSLAAPWASASDAGVVYLPPSVAGSAIYEKAILSNYQVDVPQATQDATTGATIPSTVDIDLSPYLPQNVRVEGIKVRIDTQAGNAKVVALDAAANAIASADIVPLASGFEATFPPETVQLRFENYDLNAAWSGVITVIVVAQIDVELQFQTTTIEIRQGQAIVPATIIVRSVPADGELYLTDDRPDFVVAFTDPVDIDGDGQTSGDTRIGVRQYYNPGSPLTLSVNVKITTTAPPGTYTLTVTMYYAEAAAGGGGGGGGGDQLLVSSFSLNVLLESDGAGQATVETPVEEQQEEGIPWGLIGVGIVVAVALMLILFRGRG